MTMGRARKSRLLTTLALSRANGGSPLTSQLEWAVDPQNSSGKASDRNVGTPALPLLSWDELARRIGPGGWQRLSARVDVYALSSAPAGSPPLELLVKATSRTAGVWMHGTLAVARSGQLSAATGMNRGGNAPMTVTDSAGQPWAAFVGSSFIRITSGASAGAMSELRKDLGAGVVQLGELFVPDPLGSPAPIFTLAGNETYDIVTPPSIPPIDAYVDGPRFRTLSTDLFPLILQNVAMQDDTTTSVVAGPGAIAMATCTIGSCSWESDLAVVQQVIMRSGSIHTIEGGCTCNTYGGMLYEAILTVNDGDLQIGRDWGPQTASMVLVAPAQYCDFTEATAFDCDTPFTVYPGAAFQALGYGGTHTLWGTGQTTTCVQIAAGAQMVTYSTDTLVVTGGGAGFSEFMLDSLHATPYVRADNGAFVAAPLACSWANLKASNAAGGFGGNATEPVSGARIVTSLAF